MEEQGSEERACLPPQLLNLIPDEREWKAREARGGGTRPRTDHTTGFDTEDYKDELDLKLGLPGVVQQEDGVAAAAAGPRKKMQAESCSSLSLGCCYTPHPKLTSTGAKRGFFDTVEAKPDGYDQRCQDREGCGNELTLGAASMAGERKKGCCPIPPPLSVHASAAAPVHSSSSPHGRAAVLPVVGWPPVRSFRRNLTNGSSSKQSSPGRHNDETDDKAKLICKKRPLVKINMDGIPIGRKVNLAAYDSYQKLSSAVEELFHGFLQGQNDPPSCAESGEQEKMFSGLLDGTGEYSLVYEDDDGDRMLVGDVPWNAFVSTTKRLRVMRRAELPHNLVVAAPERADC